MCDFNGREAEEGIQWKKTLGWNRINTEKGRRRWSRERET